jgi:CysZ protein
MTASSIAPKINMMFKSLAVSFIDLFNPRILLLIFLPPVLALILWLILAWFFWGELGQLINSVFLTNQGMASFLNWLQEHLQTSSTSVGLMISFVLIALCIFPLIWVTSLLIVSIVVTPVVLAHLERNGFGNLKKMRATNLAATLGNLAIAGFMFFGLWIVSIPFWVTIGIGFLLPILVTALFNVRVLWFDVLSEHATKSERLQILKENRIELLLLGIVIAILITIPFINLVLPVYATLVFGRYCLSKLKDLRDQEQLVATT